MGDSNGILRSVSARAPNDAWAVGTYEDGSILRAMVFHWVGATWSLSAIPTFPGASALYSVTAISANDVWAVGNTSTQTLTLHWDGTAWSVVPSPNPGLGGGYLYGVDVLASTDVWAVGKYVSGALTQTLAIHWDGASWSVSPSPNPGSSADFAAVSMFASNEVWAVGSFNNGTSTRTLTERYSQVNCASSTPTPAPTSTGTPFASTATRTSIPLTITPTTPAISTASNTAVEATSTPISKACPIQFTDVPPEHHFYTWIRCLVCRGIVSGYTSSPPCTTGIPCFLPYNNVTRGQMAKMVSNAAGYLDTIPLTQQTFTDVPYSNPFWLFVERAAMHNVISGYTTNPPCVTGVPCFLPYNNMTRGQAAKVVSNAAGYQDNILPSQQTFADAPPTDPFWLYIERVSLHGVISGYTEDGVTINPCTGNVEQVGQFYFRSCNNVTRGQASKIVANAFYPGCQTPAR